MLRTSLLVAALSIPAIALACEGEHGKSEGGKGCPMPAASTTAALPASGTHARLAVTGMHCGACADKVHAALTALPGVSGATVDLANSSAEVVYDPAKVTPEQMTAAIAKLGFAARLAS